jgi:hypothetical protein
MVGAFFNFGDDFMLIAKSVIEKILEENQNEKRLKKMSGGNISVAFARCYNSVRRKCG